MNSHLDFKILNSNSWCRRPGRSTRHRRTTFRWPPRPAALQDPRIFPSSRSPMHLVAQQGPRTKSSGTAAPRCPARPENWAPRILSGVRRAKSLNKARIHLQTLVLFGEALSSPQTSGLCGGYSF